MIKKLKRLVILIIALYVRPIKSNIYDTFEGNIYFDHSSYLSKKTSDDLHTRCLKTKCEVSSLQCIQTNGILLGISPCSNLYECRMTGDYQGSCMSQDKSTKLTFLYPGDKCTSSKRDTRVCGYGPQICENNVCKGYLQEERCYRHEDCNPHLFCNRITQKCQPTRKVGDECTYDDECGREAVCYFPSTNIFKGSCHELFTIQSNSSQSVFNTLGNGISHRPGRWSEFICLSGVADKNGLCTEGYHSIKKGQKCLSNIDCQSKEDAGITSKCRCVYNEEGSSFCDLHRGDDEWKIAINAEYYQATKNCHVSQRWGECDQRILYRKWKCAEIKARDYPIIKEISKIKCIDTTNLSSQLPILEEYKKYCFFGIRLDCSLTSLILLCYLVDYFLVD